MHTVNIFWFNLQLYLGLWLVRTKLLWWWCWFFGGWSMFSAAVCQFILNTSAAGSSAVGFSWRVDGSKSAQCLSWDAPAVSSANETAGLLTERTSCRQTSLQPVNDTWPSALLVEKFLFRLSSSWKCCFPPTGKQYFISLIIKHDISGWLSLLADRPIWHFLIIGVGWNVFLFSSIFFIGSVTLAIWILL